MKVNANKKYIAFTLIELLVVIAIIGILASSAMPAYNGIIERGKIISDVNNVKNIVTACRLFADDWDGLFPSFDPNANNAGGGGGGGNNSAFSTSTAAFNVLIPEYIDQEKIFWYASKDQSKAQGPNENGVLTANENVYFYVVGQTNTGFSNSPLVGDGLMSGPGVYGQFHPWLRSRKAVIGFIGGHVNTERLTSKAAGATVRSKYNPQMTDIFAQRQTNDDGSASGGQLDTSKDNVLLPK